ncbi:hypothetical protein A2U01_0051064, partial [Trifolium medium]|nr:hypothetical protein [Trifolium medium]
MRLLAGPMERKARGLAFLLPPNVVVVVVNAGNWSCFVVVFGSFGLVSRKRRGELGAPTLKSVKCEAQVFSESKNT